MKALLGDSTKNIKKNSLVQRKKNKRYQILRTQKRRRPLAIRRLDGLVQRYITAQKQQKFCHGKICSYFCCPCFNWTLSKYCWIYDNRRFFLDKKLTSVYGYGWSHEDNIKITNPLGSTEGSWFNISPWYSIKNSNKCYSRFAYTKLRPNSSKFVSTTDIYSLIKYKLQNK